MIGQRRNDACMRDPGLLQMPGFQIEPYLAPAGPQALESDAKVRDEGGVPETLLDGLAEVHGVPPDRRESAASQ
jgi:hypothetical protein